VISVECIVCRKEMIKVREAVDGTETDIWHCIKCGRRIIDREPLLKRLAATV